MDSIILSTAYLAPIQYYSKLLKYDKVIIEKYENFIKQTYRNRCVIYGANGPLSLSIPVSKDNPKELIKDIKIDYNTNWQKIHWKSIESAYMSSPFFEYYLDELMPFYQKEYKFLIDFNVELQQLISELIEVDYDLDFTSDYIFPKDLQEIVDFREKILPKKQIVDPDFKSIEYNQVFTEKKGFQANLSIIDLLFNEGPNTINLLGLS